MPRFVQKFTAEMTARALELRDGPDPLPWRAVVDVIAEEFGVRVHHATAMHAVRDFTEAVEQDERHRAELAAAEALARPFRCDCGERFETETERNDHARAAHPEPISRPAPERGPAGQAPRGFRWRSVLDVHESHVFPPGTRFNADETAFLEPLPTEPAPRAPLPKDRGRVGRVVAYESRGGGTGEAADSPHLGRSARPGELDAQGRVLQHSRTIDLTASLSPDKPERHPIYGSFNPYTGRYDTLSDDLAPRTIFR